MSQHITELDVSLNEDDEYKFTEQGFSKIYVDLNKGAGGKFIYLWYKKGPDAPITRIQFSFNDEMSPALEVAGFEKINNHLNAGAGGDPVNLWFYRGSTVFDVPIVDLQVTTEPEHEAQQFRLGWERLACDLNRNAGGNWIHLWVKREKPTYICDIQFTADFGSDALLFQDGYIRVDENLTRGPKRMYVFLWYRQTADPKRGLNDLKISSKDEEKQSFENLQYKFVSMNLKEKMGGDPVYLWYRKDGGGCSAVRALSVVINKAAVEAYNKAGVPIIKYDINPDYDGPAEFLCYYF
ncbi:hypothetical protein EXN66_Car010918 [Channa argus]|uniref:MABP domain-containing protein n=1 Tax=Channa argus TaxID=215402 RepID=A0A6G1PY96_CHAAH|nr:hypothetical protein EXN66_Car010918 [Channa argus]KAK2901532.1 hypothetical protein Q8A73_011278 [Channa argus]